MLQSGAMIEQQCSYFIPIIKVWRNFCLHWLQKQFRGRIPSFNWVSMAYVILTKQHSIWLKIDSYFNLYFSQTQTLIPRSSWCLEVSLGSRYFSFISEHSWFLELLISRNSRSLLVKLQTIIYSFYSRYSEVAVFIQTLPNLKHLPGHLNSSRCYMRDLCHGLFIQSTLVLQGDNCLHDYWPYRYLIYK